jgi:hypothetical protein
MRNRRIFARTGADPTRMHAPPSLAGGVLPQRPVKEMSFTMRKKRREAVARRSLPSLAIATDIFAKVRIKG